MTSLPSRLGSILLIATLAALPAIGLASPSHAALVAAPQAKDATALAADLRIKVDKLTIAAEIASEDHANSEAELSQVITKHLLAQRQLAAARTNSATDSDISDNRVRAIYMSGGKAGLISGVLGARDLGDFQARLHVMNDILRADQAQAAAGVHVTNQAAAIEARLGKLTAQKLTLQNRSEAAADRVRAALAGAQKLLDAADATVKRLADEKRAADAAAAAQAFFAQLNAARAGATLAELGSAVAPNAIAAAAVAAARSRLGAPYVWGATGPDQFDCSGLTGWAYRQVGVALPRTSRQQWYAGPQVNLAGLAPGDLLFWATDLAAASSIHHVAIYIGAGLMIAAPQTGDVVKVQAVYLNGYFGAVRPQP